MLKFEKLDVYQKSLVYVQHIYEITKVFPKDEKYGIVDQLRRASVSIPANIAEGSGRYHRKDYMQFLRMARASAYECIALLQISLNQKYLENGRYISLYSELVVITKMISGLMNKLNEENDDK
ncbi:MAG: four helix bundle protein [bacterium]|nr:four helix bundle protein [bacterium]MDD5354844.1 four helix bundle protein [bacterium]MDD5756341.1 four helix bundle protein [bacterium]